LKQEFAKASQDNDLDNADDMAAGEHEKSRGANKGATSGNKYDDWKQKMIDDDLAAARDLEDALVRGQNIPGDDPESTFADQDEENMKKRDEFLKDL